MDDMPENEWIAAFAHGLQKHWRTVDPTELEAVATELSHDRHLRAMRPTDAASEWLRPVACGNEQPSRRNPVDEF